MNNHTNLSNEGFLRTDISRHYRAHLTSMLVGMMETVSYLMLCSMPVPKGQWPQVMATIPAHICPPHSRREQS